ncbi:MAG: signal peptidase I [Anaerolineae bacterium]|nr:signal peptidase I [Anaerolineae bacterium]
MREPSGEQLRTRRGSEWPRRELAPESLRVGHPPTPGEPGPAEAGEERRGSLLQEVLETILLGVVLFVAMRSVLQSTRVISRSMVPTLQEGQYLLVNKLAYRIGDVSRGDIAVFRSPQDPELILIKRVIGLPGEEILISEGGVFVNGEQLVEPYLAPGSSASVWGPVVLGPDQYLMLGDNRNNSNDSRFFGPVSRSAIIGKAWFSIWPPGGVNDGIPQVVSPTAAPSAGEGGGYG